MLNETDKKLLNRLKQIRNEKGLSQTELGRLIGVSKNTISSIETGQHSPSSQTAYLLCKVLNKRFDELFYFEE